MPNTLNDDLAAKVSQSGPEYDGACASDKLTGTYAGSEIERARRTLPAGSNKDQTTVQPFKTVR